MHHIPAVGFIFTATSLCACGINSKCCDPSRQLVEQTATAHRAEQAVSSKSQLIFSCTTLTSWFIYMACLSPQSDPWKTRHTAFPAFSYRPNSCNWYFISFFSPVTQTLSPQMTSLVVCVVLKPLIFVSLCSTWCLIHSLSWAGSTGDTQCLLRSMCLLHWTSIWTLSTCSCSCCSSSASVANSTALWLTSQKNKLLPFSYQTVHIFRLKLK